MSTYVLEKDRNNRTFKVLYAIKLLHSNVDRAVKISTSDKKIPITTRTGEPYQPARVYYQVSNQRTVVGAFRKLKCMQFEPFLNCWRWLYEREA